MKLQFGNEEQITEDAEIPLDQSQKDFRIYLQDVLTNYSPDDRFTVIVSDPAPSGTYLHYLVVNSPPERLQSGITLQDYMPPERSDHHYLFEIYKQRRDLKIENVPRREFDVAKFVKTHGLTPEASITITTAAPAGTDRLNHMGGRSGGGGRRSGGHRSGGHRSRSGSPGRSHGGRHSGSHGHHHGHGGGFGRRRGYGGLGGFGFGTGLLVGSALGYPGYGYGGDTYVENNYYDDEPIFDKFGNRVNNLNELDRYENRYNNRDKDGNIINDHFGENQMNHYNGTPSTMMHHTSGRVGFNRMNHMDKNGDYEDDEDLTHCNHCGRYVDPVRKRLYQVDDLPDAPRHDNMENDGDTDSEEDNRINILGTVRRSARRNRR